MKASGKQIGRLFVGCVLAFGLITITQKVIAIEGLQISQQCSNVVLSWPSGGGHNYIVQYRQTLSDTDSWQTLTSAWPDSGTNITVFVHSNIVQNPSCGCDSVGSSLFALAATTLAPVQTGPMAMPADGSGGAVPLALYPPGFDLTGLLIFDPITGETINGAGYSNHALSAMAASASASSFNGPVPMGGIGGSGGVVGTPETGFYEVVEDGVQILDSSIAILTNGVISGTVNIGFETGNAAYDGTGTNLLGTLDCAYLIIDGNKYPGDGMLSFPMDGPRQFAMDTAYLENGTHTIQIQDTWLNPDNSNGNNVEIERQSDAVTITVSNVISYPNWEPEIGETGISAYFLETTCTDADWHIDIYDVSNKLAQTLSGHTPDGIIEAYWNMIDTNGVTRTNADIDPEFSAIVTVADPQTAATPHKVQRKKTTLTMAAG